MAKYQICGNRPIQGSTSLPGAKNAVTKILIASLLSDQCSILKNVPEIAEIDLTLRLLRSFGSQIEKKEAGCLEIRRGSKFTNIIPESEAMLNRMAVLTIAPLLHTFGSVKLPKVMGGDKIGPRPINFHIDAYRQFGVDIEEDADHYHFQSSRLQGTTIELAYPSVSTTENVLLAASLAQGTTVLKNAAIEPEVMDLVLFLQKMGAVIEMHTDRTIIVEGQESLRSAEHMILPDRIACASYGALALATGGEIDVVGARQEHMLSFLNTLRRMKAPFYVKDDGIIFGNGKKNPMQAVHLETHVHPGFMTDWQPPLVILMTQAEGMSILHETVYENRLGYTRVLEEMGAHIEVSSRCLGGIPCRFHFKDHFHSCIVNGPSALKATSVTVPDLRAGFSYVIAALCAEGKSTIDKVEEIERGYGMLDEVLRKLGADIKRID